MITFTVVAIALPASLLTGALVFFRACIAREESDRSLFFHPKTRSSAVTRRVHGLYIRTSHCAQPVGSLTQDLDAANTQRGFR